jgi:hypothetical protein
MFKRSDKMFVQFAESLEYDTAIDVPHVIRITSAIDTEPVALPVRNSVPLNQWRSRVLSSAVGVSSENIETTLYGFLALADIVLWQQVTQTG